jgi:tetratricopeptide (TPR) repeat protein
MREAKRAAERFRALGPDRVVGRTMKVLDRSDGRRPTWHAPPVSSSTPTPNAVSAAERADALLALARTRDAAHFALAALALDDRCALAWSVIARILSAVGPDPLATLTTRHALDLDPPLSAEDRRALERHHRIDLWTRGLISHASGAAILPASAFDDSSQLRDTADLGPWFDDQLSSWSSMNEAANAARKMVAALSDAQNVPAAEEENPLRVEEGWTDKPELAFLRAHLGEELEKPLPKVVADAAEPREVTVISDHWMEEEVIGFATRGDLSAALDRAELWRRLRPDRIAPLAAKVRLGDAAKDEGARERAVGELLAASAKTTDLNELEEARFALGELRLWRPQIEVLDRMERIAGPHPVILANRGVAFIELGEHERGVSDLERAIELDPNNAPALANLGLERMRNDQYLEARVLLERAVEEAPEQPEARLYLAACKNNQGDREGALEELDEVLRCDPGNEKAKQLKDELTLH